MTQKYFQSLNYSMANEDTSLEYKLALAIQPRNILTVGGSGSRALPFLALDLDELRIVDVSSDQLMLIQLKLESIRQLSRPEAILFWTSEDSQKRADLFRKMKVDENTRLFFHFHSDNNPMSAALYWGKWEKTFQTFSKLTQIMFSKDIREGLFASNDPYTFYQKHIAGWRWELLLKVVGNKAMFNSLLYKGSFIKKNSPLSYFEYYYQAFDRLFKLDIKRSHFLQLCFCGKVLLEEALPIEFSPELFEKIKLSKTVPIYEQGSIFERQETTTYDLISLSDVPSYLSGELEQSYVQKMAKNVSPQGLIVNRFYLRSSENTDISSFKEVTEQYSEIINQELVQMYQVQLLKKVLPAP